MKSTAAAHFLNRMNKYIVTNEINFNDRSRLLDLIEFARASAASYGITAILEHFLDDQIENKKTNE